MPEENVDGKTQALETDSKPAEVKIHLKNRLRLALAELFYFDLDLSNVSESCACFKRQLCLCTYSTVCAETYCW